MPSAALIDRRSNSAIQPLGAIARGRVWYVDTQGTHRSTGKSWRNAFSTMAAALAVADTYDEVWFVGDVREEITGSNLKFGITIRGVGGLHHADQPDSTNPYLVGSSVWRPPASPTAATPLLNIRGRGWRFSSILFDAPVDAACLLFERDAGSGTAELDASHYRVEDCDFRNGLYGIQDKGGCYNGLIQRNMFETLDATSSGCAIIATNVVNAWRRHRILRNYFQPDSTTEGNERHIVGAFNGAEIRGNTFGTVKGTGKYIDLTGGADNVVCENILAGLYDTTDYVAGTRDIWYDNKTVVKATTSPDGHTLTVPAA